MGRRNIGTAVAIAAIGAVVVSMMLNFELGWAEISITVAMAAALGVVTLRLL